MNTPFWGFSGDAQDLKNLWCLLGFPCQQWGLGGHNALRSLPRCSVTPRAGQPLHIGVVCGNLRPSSRHVRVENHPTALAMCHPACPVIHCFCSDLPGASELIAAEARGGKKIGFLGDETNRVVESGVYPHQLNHRITEWSGLEGTSVGHLVQPPTEAGSPRAGCTGPRPGGS